MISMPGCSTAGRKQPMKNQHSKPGTPAMTEGDNTKTSPAAKADSLILTSDHRDAPFEHWPRPTELQLAELAARLARTEKFDPKQLVAEAWSLYWESCMEVQRMLAALEVQHDGALIEEQESLSKPEKFPVTFTEMERLLLTKLKGRTGERAAVFREYAFAQLVAGSFKFGGDFRVLDYWDFQPEALQELRERLREMVAERFGTWRKSIYDAAAYAKFASPFLHRYSRWTAHRRSQVKADNARKGWAGRQDEKKAKTGARPKKKVLKEIVEGPAPKTSWATLAERLWRKRKRLTRSVQKSHA
jgi:hypothetical protein